MERLFVPIAVFVMITVSIGLITRLIATFMLNKTIREALRSDPGSVPLLAGKLEQRQPWADALLGWIMLAFAATLVLLALFEEPWERVHMFQAAIVPAVIGVTVLVYCRIMAPKAGG